MRRRGFTLIELLVVISIIAVLAALLLPTVTLVKTKANDLKCSNHLRQMASAMMVYALERDEVYPGCMNEIFLPEAGLALRGIERLMICPRDRLKGADNHMGRAYFDNSGDISYLYEGQGGQFTPLLGVPRTHAASSSYVYEVGQIPVQSWNEINFFYMSLPAPSRPPPMTVTWYEAKRHELNNGLKNSAGEFGPFAADVFPIIRCFHHHRWSGADHPKKVNNVGWNGNIFWSSPEWEKDVTGG